MKKMSNTIKSAVLLNNKKIKTLRPIFQQWIKINEEYCDTYPSEDCPYWYNERAAVSILAGAVWKSSGLALEEFSSNKKYGRSGYLGRADLWFSFGKKKSQDYLIEAKYERLSLFSNYYKLEKRIAKNIKSAIADAKNSQEDASLMLGVTFLVPYIPPSAQHNENQRLVDFYKLLKGMQLDVLAIYFNPYVIKDEDGYSYPCIAMVGDVVS